MKFSCPYCRKECDFMDLQLDGDLRTIIAMSDGFGRHRALVWAYTELFGVSPMRANAKKLRKILEEMKALFDAGAFAYQKRRYSISAEGIAEALNVMVHRSFPDSLDSHNYLKKVMISIAEREGKAAGRQAEADLRKREAVAMTGHRDSQTQTLTDHSYKVTDESIEPPAPRLRSMPKTALSDAEYEANRQRLKQMMETIG